MFGESTLGAFTLLWAISEDELTVKMQTENDVWVGIGLEPEDGGMTNADMYLGYNDGAMKVVDCWSSGKRSSYTISINKTFQGMVSHLRMQMPVAMHPSLTAEDLFKMACMSIGSSAS